MTYGRSPRRTSGAGECRGPTATDSPGRAGARGCRAGAPRRRWPACWVRAGCRRRVPSDVRAQRRNRRACLRKRPCTRSGRRAGIAVRCLRPRCFRFPLPIRMNRLWSQDGLSKTRPCRWRRSQSPRRAVQGPRRGLCQRPSVPVVPPRRRRTLPGSRGERRAAANGRQSRLRRTEKMSRETPLRARRCASRRSAREGREHRSGREKSWRLAPRGGRRQEPKNQRGLGFLLFVSLFSITYSRKPKPLWVLQLGGGPSERG